MRKPALAAISSLLIVNLFFISRNNDTVQEFISKSRYNSSRRKYLDDHPGSLAGSVDGRAGAATTGGGMSKNEFGYLPSLLEYLLSVRAADSIALVAAGIIFNNRTLSRVVVTKDLVHFVTGVLRKYGPSQKLVGLFSAMISGSRKHISKNQRLVLEVVCSTTADPVFLDNRRSIMIETQLHNERDVYVAWSGSAQYIRGRSIDAELFYDPATLGLKTRPLAAPRELQEYLKRRSTSTRGDAQGGVTWTKLAGLAWHIDPEHCYYFWRGSPVIAWRKYLEEMSADETAMKPFRENLEQLKSLCEHYLGVIELYTDLCTHR